MSMASRRPGVLGVHSLDHFEIAVPDLDVARNFYKAFGLDVREANDGLDLYTFGHLERAFERLRALTIDDGSDERLRAR